jgi:hypothetical protein
MWYSIEAMLNEKQKALLALAAVFAVFLGYAIFVNHPPKVNGFLFADQAVYFAMTESIAFDGDLEYTKKDLARYYQSYAAGPVGIFLKKAEDGRIFYAKSFAYPLFAAPFVRLFGVNGFFVFHALGLLLVLLMGFSWFSRSSRPGLSLLAVSSFVFATAGYVYYFWIAPDFFNFFLVFSVLFLWGYKKKAGDPAEGEDIRPGRLKAFLLSDSSDYLAAFLAGIAVFSKPPNIVLMIPIGLGLLLQKKVGKAFLAGVFFLASAAALFGANYLLTSDWNFMGGERKSFYFVYPLEKSEVTFDSTGHAMTSEDYFERALVSPKFLIYNVFYYVFGRFTGLAWYFFPAVLFLILFFAAPKKPYQWLILAALALHILIYLILMPTNYGGGGGSVANRYFLNIYPLFFFLPAMTVRPRHIVAIWAMAAVFIAPLILSPLQSSMSPAAHAKKFPVKALPLEMTLVNEFPTNTNPHGFRVPCGTPPHDGILHFLDDNFNPKSEPEGLWTLGARTTEMVLKTYFPVREITVRLTNNVRRDNTVRVRVGRKTQKVVLQPRERRELVFPVGTGFRIGYNHHHRIKIGAAKASIPYFEDEKSEERRNLGVFFELVLTPRD